MLRILKHLNVRVPLTLISVEYKSSPEVMCLLNVIYTFSLLIEEASDIVLVCDCLFCGVFQLFAKTALFWLMLCTECVGSLSLHWSGTNAQFMMIFMCDLQDDSDLS